MTRSACHRGRCALLAAGKRTFFFIAADYAYGTSIQAEASRVILAEHGQVVGSVRHPIGTPDFSSYLLQAQASRADVTVLANGGADTTNAVNPSYSGHGRDSAAGIA